METNKERETKEIETPNGHKAVVYTYATGREKRQILNVIMAKTKVGMIGKESNVNVEASLVGEMEDMAIKAFVVSLNGSPERVLEQVLDLPAEDYDVIAKYANSLTDDKKKLESSLKI